MERKIGEVFEFAGRKLLVEESQSIDCTGCYFEDRVCRERITGACPSDARSDKKNVIFKDVTDKKEEL